MTSAGGVGVTQGFAVGVDVGEAVAVSVGRLKMSEGVSGAQAARNKSRMGKYFFICHIIHTIAPQVETTHD